ncbi:carbohydrate ABC transporter permease [Nakamurella flavida]|uniref:Carbohydrate ABC transporter permease n=1 Tax=Nakamurella flavida TaxID=363630 RepID=A0A938YNS1_9ACTN|nr:carbohydrate ABC transporter permease [Nakamurella flavida]MBM9477941.1 carbohydrate ABC transporter permease [Nakamurella flavida]MDP9778343.1 ABC-type glycerol-3-phosphate transport system permease component [Nakamurella flavida]
MTSPLMTGEAVQVTRNVPRPARRRRRGLDEPSWLESTIVFLTLAITVLVCLFPFLWMIRTALTPTKDAFSTDPSILPSSLTLGNFGRVLTSPSTPFVQQFFNTLLVSTATTVLVIIFGITGAYALARLKFVGRRAFGMTLLIVQLFPGVLLVIPLFVVLVNLNLTNSYLGLILAYSTTNLPFVVWFLRGYFLSIPEELGEAARIDGCTHLGVLFRIVLPLARPGIAAAATLAMVSAWNEYLFAFILIKDSDKRVLSTGLASFIEQFTADYSGLFAMATLTTIPIVAVFLLFQRHLVGGLAAGGVKG